MPFGYSSDAPRSAPAEVAKLADAQALEACARKGVRVQIPPSALDRTIFAFPIDAMKRTKKAHTIHTRNGTYRALIWRDARDKAYLVRVPSLPGVVTFGTTLAEAKKMARGAIELHFKRTIPRTIPVDKNGLLKVSNRLLFACNLLGHDLHQGNPRTALRR